MLDIDTRRRIDTARDILVGKVPDPKSQVEQITIALIYKFMDDLDAESEELGGERNFFSGDFARYGWAKLMHPSLGGYETLSLYAEAITRMPENPGIPLLFRDIFNNAYLPYRDPETLRAFLKVIDEFTYDHSERLGDAFEYLLSVLGAQGDAGQFRTPRHIIDFIVSVVDPKKNDIVLDPACGTAGFLISAYKHILAANADGNGQSMLTPDDRGRLVNNFKGYDISPDMVRLSLVNMYLHGFREPHIYEYDTLTSEERWNEYADVVLANPPFMSPRGGIRPHNRFSVKSTRSEVLFVDYMAEHLSPEGRAGIIVPEGIIFQSQTAYRQLRKMLVEDYLVAVVSLPAGVFNPYSGVKTSVLILDRALAKRTDSIAFFRLENDGFDLGAQRRRIDKNDLPHAQTELGEYLDRLRGGESVDDFRSTLSIVVEKKRVGEDGEYSLSGERYKENIVGDHKFPVAKIGEVCNINPRKSELVDRSPDTLVSFVPMVDLNENRMLFQPMQEKLLAEVLSSYTYFADDDVLLARVTPCFENGKAGIARGLLNGIGFGSSEFIVLRCGDGILPEWMYFCVTHPLFRNWAVHQMTGTGGLQRVPRSSVAGFQVPLPPLEVQREIVAEIAGYQKMIDGARAVVENYSPNFKVNPEWPLVAIQDLAKPQYGFTASAQDQGDARFIRITDITEGGGLSPEEQKFITLTGQSQESLLARGDILVARTGATYGKTMLFDEDYPAVFASYLIRLRFPSDVIDPRFYWTFAQSDTYWNQAKALVSGGGQPQFNGNAIKLVKLPVPPLAMQQAVVAEIEVERGLVDANKELIRRFESKIQAAVGRVWETGASAAPDS